MRVSPGAARSVSATEHQVRGAALSGLNSDSIATKRRIVTTVAHTLGLSAG